MGALPPVAIGVQLEPVEEARPDGALMHQRRVWGERLGEGDDLIASWRALGTFLRRCSGANAYILSGASELTRHLGLRSSQRWPIKIGPLDARWLHYEMR